MMYDRKPAKAVLVRAPTYKEAVTRAQAKYGNSVHISTWRPIEYGGLMRLFKRDEVEITCFLSDHILNPLAPKAPLSLEEEKKKFLAMNPPKQDEGIKEVLAEIRSLKEKVDTPAAITAQKEVHPSIERIRELLFENDFSPSYAKKIEERLKKEFSLEDLGNFETVENAVVDWIGESISMYDTQNIRKSKVYILVGPTGVGKTTTIAKLAAMYGVVPDKPLDVRILTIDNYRVGARDQIEKYGVWMRIPVNCVEDAKELKKYINLYRDVDLILIDTVGKSPRDFVTIGEMRELLDAAFKNASIHLALSATTKTNDLTEIMQQFEPFAYDSVLITKLDETPRVGSVISAVAQRGKALSFITDGQKVPENIKAASKEQFLTRLTGFRVRKEHITGKIGGKGV